MGGIFITKNQQTEEDPFFLYKIDNILIYFFINIFIKSTLIFIKIFITSQKVKDIKM